MTDKSNDDDKKVTVSFAPGCFDSFEGTQEELDDFIKELTEMAESGELLKQSMEPLNMEQLIDDDPEMAIRLMAQMGELDNVIAAMEADGETPAEDIQEVKDLIASMDLPAPDKKARLN